MEQPAPESIASVPPEYNPSIYGRCLLALVGGAIGPLAFSPNNMWLLGLLSVCGLYLALKYSAPRQGAIIGWFFGLGFFGVGASWVYVSIHDYGNAGEFFAGFLTAIFVAGIALLFSLQCWLTQRFFNRSFYLFSFAALWVLGEWFRGWFLTGFPWLYLGYAHTQSGFSGVAPLFGVMGISLVVAISGAALGEMFLVYRKTRSLFNVARSYIPTGLFFLWIGANLTGSIEWVEPVAGESVEVGIVQANIDQGRKFDNDFIQENLDRYDTLSGPLWDADAVIWPETAIPYVYDQADNVLRYFTVLGGNDTTLISGIFGRTEEGLHNSIVSAGNGSGIYHKQKLVPFGEYVPLRFVFSTLLRIFDLPMSSLEKGPAGQDMLVAGDYNVAPFICYEVVYPDFVRRHARGADYLVTISNDTWFGASWGPLQHLEMAAMRALENGRYMVRATNNGVSAIINEKGEILSRTAQFQEEVLRGDVRIYRGRTPFSLWGSWPIILICASILFIVSRYSASFQEKLARLQQR